MPEVLVRTSVSAEVQRLAVHTWWRPRGGAFEILNSGTSTDTFLAVLKG